MGFDINQSLMTAGKNEWLDEWMKLVKWWKARCVSGKHAHRKVAVSLNGSITHPPSSYSTFPLSKHPPPLKSRLGCSFKCRCLFWLNHFACQQRFQGPQLSKASCWICTQWRKVDSRAYLQRHILKIAFRLFNHSWLNLSVVHRISCRWTFGA